MHVAAHDPSPVAIDRDGVPKDLVEKESEILRRQAEQEGKPPAVTEKIVQGRLKKFYGEVCLLEQAFVKNPDQSISQLLEDAAKELGQAVRVGGFVRFKLGETAADS
jgi:elongation factor Ts